MKQLYPLVLLSRRQDHLFGSVQRRVEGEDDFEVRSRDEMRERSFLLLNGDDYRKLHGGTIRRKRFWIGGALVATSLAEILRGHGIGRHASFLSRAHCLLREHTRFGEKQSCPLQKRIGILANVPEAGSPLPSEARFGPVGLG